MEAAASLFGPEDASSDPFASLGGQEASVEVPQVDQNAPQTGHSTDVDPNGSTFFDQTSSQDSFYNSGNGGNTVQEPAYSYGATPVYPPQHDGMPVQQNYQPTAANGHGYQTETSNYSAPAQVTPTPSSYEPRQSPSNGYAPASNTTYQLATYGQQYTPTTSYNVDGMPNQSTGQSYQPTTYGSYAPNGGTNSQPGYGTPSYAPTYPVQQTPVAPPPASNFRVPPPTTTTVKAVARPKVANAYDPPIPAARPSRRQTPRVSSAPQPYGYNAYETQRTPSVGSSLSTPPPHMNGYHQPSLPPPPPKPPQPAYDQTHARSLPPPPPRAPSSAGQQASYGVYGGTLSTSPPEWNPASMGNGHSASYVAPSLNGAANGLMDTSAPSYPPEASEDFFDQVASEPQQHGAWETNHVQPDLAAKPHDVHNTRDSPPAHLTEPDWLSQQNAEAKPVEDDPPTSSHPSIPEEYPDPESADLESSSDASGIPSDQISSSTNETRATSPPGPPPARYSPVVQPSVYAPPRTSSPLAGPPISRTSMDSYAPPRAASPASSFRESQPPANPYAPPTQTQHPNGHRTSSPLATMRANTLGYPQEKPFTSPPPRTDRNRSMSGGSLLSISSLSAEDPYAPSRRIASSGALGQHRQASPVQHRGGTPDPPVAQELPLKHVFQSHYAPSPSLLGANDPLGRTTARVPVISFGFGGKMVTCFHGADSFSTGFDVALSSRNTTQIRLRSLKSLIPEAHQDHTSSFPGPLFGDPGSQTTSLVRTGPNTHTKNKKTQVVKYLTDRATELELGLRYLETDSLAYGRSNGKLILTKLLKVMVEHDGKLSGSPEIDMAVRTVLVPALEVTAEPSTFMTMTDTTSFGYPAVAGQGGSSGQELSTTVLKASHLEKIEEFLMRGERKKAYHYALDEKLWAHAMVIASSIDKDAWKEVVGEFLKGELGSKPAETSGNASQGRESLRVVYSLFSGQGPSAVQEFNPQNLLLRATAATQLQPPLASQITPKTPNFVAPVQPVPTIASLAKWPETVAMMLSSPLPAETSAALTALGDQLSAAQLHEASHVCYMLSPQTSPLGGLGQAAARLTLIGSKSPQAWSLFSKDPDPFVFSEVLEFALSFTPVAKGQEPFAGIAHLQAYRFIRATSLVDLGDIQQANRYCEAISASLSRVSPYTTTTLLEQLKELSDRIAGTTQVDKSFWSGGKISKPSLNNIGGWLEGRFTKLVTGDEEKTPEEDKKPEGREFSGPFSQYSTISSTTPSARSSPQPTHVNPHTLPPPARSGSAMASASPYAYQPIDRASSAMDHVRRKSTPQPPPRATPASSTATSFYNTPSFGSLQSQENLVTPRASNVGEDDPQDAGAWWNSTGYDEGPAGKTPTTATFMKVNHEVPANESTDGFISLMDNHPYSVGPSRPSSEASHRSPVSRPSFDEDEDDLGLSNSKPKPKKTDTSETLKPEAKVEETPQPAQPAESKPELQQNGSWFSRWWKKSDGPGPVKANLGEQSAFYYDKELKRWVNKNAPPEETKPAAPPPPPSRAQTASPGMTGHHPPPSPGGTPPPARAASAIDLSTSPPSRTVMRVRSNLVPPGAPESAPSTPTGSRLAPSGPPPGRPKSQASKRNVRNRYVDVFSQENGGNGAA